MEKPWHQTDTNCPLFLCKFGPLDTEKKKKQIYVYLLYQTESPGKAHVTLSQKMSFLRKDAFEKVGYWDVVGKVKDLKDMYFLRQRFSLWEWEYFPWKPRAVFSLSHFIGNADLIASHRCSSEGGAGVGEEDGRVQFPDWFCLSGRLQPKSLQMQSSHRSLNLTCFIPKS